MKTYLKILWLALIFLAGCASAGKLMDKVGIPPPPGERIFLNKQWTLPDGTIHRAWTYKRKYEQSSTWSMFGNDNDGCQPYFHDRIWGFWEWWGRNSMLNFNWYDRGYANWVEGDAWGSHDTSHLKFCHWIGGIPGEITDRAPGVQIRWVRKKNEKTLWMPFFSIQTPSLKFAWGWGRRGEHKFYLELDAVENPVRLPREP